MNQMNQIFLFVGAVVVLFDGDKPIHTTTLGRDARNRLIYINMKVTKKLDVVSICFVSRYDSK